MQADPSRATSRVARDLPSEEQLRLGTWLLALESLPEGRSEHHGQVLHALDVGPLRGTYRVVGEDSAYVIKLYRPRSIFEFARRYLRRNRAVHEFEVLTEARRRGLPVPRALGAANPEGARPGHGVLWLEDLGPGRGLDESALDVELCERVGALLATAIRSGLVHRDLHLGNVYRSANDELFLVDLQKAHFATAARRLRSDDLEPLYLSVPWPEQEPLRHALLGPLQLPATPSWLLPRLRRHLSRRLRRCERSSGVFEVREGQRVRRGVPDAPRTANEWRARIASGTRVKEGRRGYVARLGDGLWAKERDMAHAHALWRAAFALELRHVPAPRALALVPGSPGRAVVVSEEARGAPLDDLGAAERAPALRSLGHDLGRLHASGWRFRDGRGDNFVAEAGGRVQFVDLDGMRPGPGAAKDLGRLLAWARFQSSDPPAWLRQWRVFARAYLRSRARHGAPVRSPRGFFARVERHCRAWKGRHPELGRSGSSAR